MIGGQQERLRKEQMRENLEQLVIVKQELRNYPHLEVIEKVGQGSFGDIYKVWDSKRARWAAMKLEKKEKKNKFSLIKKEAQIMMDVKGSKYFAILFDSRFNEMANYNFIEMSFLGPNLENLKKRVNSQFSLRTVLLIANQMISGIQILHQKGIIHRDIKPENFVIGSDGLHHQVYIIDFGLSKYFIDENKKHIEQKSNKGLVGTARYTSINSHLGLEQSRRDDLESIAYLLLYFVKGTLVWQNLQFKDKEERFKKIAELKQVTSHEVMCKGLPRQFFEFLTLVKSLSFEQTPDYERYRSLFSQCYTQNFTTPENKSCYDWCPKNCQLQPKPISKVVSIKNLQDSLSTAPQSTTKNNGNNNTNNTQKNIQQQQLQQQQLQQNNPLILEVQQSTLTQNILDKKLITTSNLEATLVPNFNSNNQNYNNNNGIQSINVIPNGMNQSKSGQQQIEQIDLKQKKENNLLEILDKQASDEVYNKQLDRFNFNEFDDDIDEAPMSEFRKGQKKDIPIFRAEGNLSKHQQLALSQINLIQSVNQQYDDHRISQNKNSNQIQNGLQNSNQIHNRLQNSNQIENGQQNSNQAHNLLFSSPSHLLVQPFSNINLINKDSSQYGNNFSNEWNSQQDEKVEVQIVAPFNPQNNQSIF